MFQEVQLKYYAISSGCRSLDSTLTLSLFSVGLLCRRNPKLLRTKITSCAWCSSWNYLCCSSLESDMGFLTSVKIYLIKDVTLLLRKPHWTNIWSTVFSSLLFQMDLVGLGMVQKMATETIWGNGTTVIWEEIEKSGTLQFRERQIFIIEIYKIMKGIKKPDVKLLPSKSRNVRTRGHSVKVVGDQA